MTTLGDQIRAARQARDLSQGEVAEGICSTAYLSRIETGQREPTKKVLAALMERLDVHPSKEAEQQPVSLEWSAAAAVAHAADQWLATPTDRRAYARLLDSVDWWRRATAPSVEVRGVEPRS